MEKQTKIAMLSYNTFLPGQSNGWVDGNLFLIQNDNGSAWGVRQFLPVTQFTKLQAEDDQLVKDKVSNHWQVLQGLLPQFSKVLIYVGDRGSEHTIEYAHQNALEASKAVFLVCCCNTAIKKRTIQKHGFASSQIIHCECGGQRRMRVIAEDFLSTGKLFF